MINKTVFDIGHWPQNKNRSLTLDNGCRFPINFKWIASWGEYTWTYFWYITTKTTEKSYHSKPRETRKKKTVFTACMRSLMVKKFKWWTPLDRSIWIQLEWNNIDFFVFCFVVIVVVVVFWFQWHNKQRTVLEQNDYQRKTVFGNGIRNNILNGENVVFLVDYCVAKQSFIKVNFSLKSWNGRSQEEHSTLFLFDVFRIIYFRYFADTPSNEKGVDFNEIILKQPTNTFSRSGLLLNNGKKLIIFNSCESQLKFFTVTERLPFTKYS